MSAPTYLPFRPALDGPFLDRFLHAAQVLAALPEPEARHAHVAGEVAWAEAEASNPRQRGIYCAVWLLLGDLLRVRWDVRIAEGRLEVAPPPRQDPRSNEAVLAAKAAVREVMIDARRARLAESREFITSAESATSVRRRAWRPVTDLVADGPALASRLREVATLDPGARPRAAAQVVCPYLQLVVGNERCAFTGQRLKDVWRYFRLTWATPAETTPGRTLLYLVRDAAQPLHPVMGLLSLENAPILVRERDEFLGWSPDLFRRRLLQRGDSEETRRAFGRLLAYISAGLDDVDLREFCTPAEAEHPSDSLLRRLAAFAARSGEDLSAALARWQRREDDDEQERSELGDISKEAEEALFRRKRADAAGRLLSARLALRGVLAAVEFDDRWASWLASEAGQGAVRAAYLALKSRHVGTSILELNVCGAVPPYNELLGGKLAALLALSPTVVVDYRARYGDRSSDIASQLKGVPVTRRADLVYLGTTSLYAVGASQYNRLSLPPDLFGPGSAPMRWEPIRGASSEAGETSGFGTLHISRRTLRALDHVIAGERDRVQRTNHVMGEGPSPKLRAVKAALNSVMAQSMGTDIDQLARHAMPRLIYGAWLATNGREYLLSVDPATRPAYPYETPDALARADRTTAEHAGLDGAAAGTARIISFWHERWLAARLGAPGVLDRVAAFDATAFRVSRDLPTVDVPAPPPIGEVRKFMPTPEPTRGSNVPTGPVASEAVPYAQNVGSIAPSATVSRESGAFAASRADASGDDRAGDGAALDFLERLYFGASAFADGTPPELLERLHVATPLDDAVLDAVTAGRDVVLTGNPGDGKTHLLRVLEARLRVLPTPPDLVLDASSIANDALYARWSAARAARVPFAVAINEAVLFRLAAEYPDFEPLAEATRQVTDALRYGDDADAPDRLVTTFDLSRRDVLAPAVVGAALERLTDLTAWPRCSRCPTAGCDFTRHRQLLAHPRVRARLQQLLDRVSRRGFHATLRDLQGLLSYALLGGQTCAGRLAAEGDHQSLFHRLYAAGGDGLFQQLRETFDPAQATHPVWDDQVVDGTTEAAHWADPSPSLRDALDPTHPADLARIRDRKRAFYFAHAHGDGVLALAGDDESRFGTFLDECAAAPSAARRRLARLVNRFFGDADASTEVRIWEAHQYRRAPRRTTYTAAARPLRAFELVRPRLRASMASAFPVAADHVLFRVGTAPHLALRVDYSLHHVLLQAERGVPALALEGVATRRLWRFMEQLAISDDVGGARGGAAAPLDAELTVVILNRETRERLTVHLDPRERRYLSVDRSDA